VSLWRDVIRSSRDAPGAKAHPHSTRKLVFCVCLCSLMNARVRSFKSCLRSGTNLADCGPLVLLYVPRPSFICIQRYDPQQGLSYFLLHEFPFEVFASSFWLSRVLDIVPYLTGRIAYHQFHSHQGRD